MNDIVKQTIDLAAERALTVVDEAAGFNPGVTDPMGRDPVIPVPANGKYREADTGLNYKEIMGADTESLHAQLPQDKQAYYAEEMLKQKLEQEKRRFEQEMEKDRSTVERSKLLIGTAIKIVTWVAMILVVGFVFLVAILGITGYKAGALSDTSILSAIVSFFSSVIGALTSN